MKFQCQTCAYIYEGDSVPEKCPVCHNNSFMEYDYAVLKDLKCSPELINTMQNLKKSDIIEYELKMSQFRTQYEQQQTAHPTQQHNTPTCPYCKSTNIKKISATSRLGSTILFGIGSKKIGKQWHCNNCKSDF